MPTSSVLIFVVTVVALLGASFLFVLWRMRREESLVEAEMKRLDEERDAEIVRLRAEAERLKKAAEKYGPPPDPEAIRAELEAEGVEIRRPKGVGGAREAEEEA